MADTQTATTTPASTPAHGPGYKSTEFWISLIAVLLGGFLASGILPAMTWQMQLGGVIAAALGQLGYTVSRTMVKVGAQGVQAAAAAAPASPAFIGPPAPPTSSSGS